MANIVDSKKATEVILTHIELDLALYKIGHTKVRMLCKVNWSLEQPTLASFVALFLLGHFPTNECEISDFCL